MQKVDLRNRYGKWFKAYIKAKGLEDSDQYSTIDYQRWLKNRHQWFEKLEGIEPDEPYTDEDHKRFIDFLEGVIS